MFLNKIYITFTLICFWQFVNAQNPNNRAWQRYAKNERGVYTMRDFSKTKIAHLAKNDSLVWYAAYIIDSMECVAELPR